MKKTWRLACFGAWALLAVAFASLLLFYISTVQWWLALPLPLILALGAPVLLVALLLLALFIVTGLAVVLLLPPKRLAKVLPAITHGVLEATRRLWRISYIFLWAVVVAFYLGYLILLWQALVGWVGLTIPFMILTFVPLAIFALVVLVLFILALVTTLLFVPMKYEGSFRTGGQEDGPAFHIKVRCLAGLVSWATQMEKGQRKTVTTILGVPFEKDDQLLSPEPSTQESEPLASIYAALEDAREKLAVPETKIPTPEKPPTLKEKFTKMRNRIKEVLTYPHLKFIIGETIDTLKDLWHIIRPKKLKISGTIGFDDPSKTGMFFAAYGVAADIFKLGSHVKLMCAFDTQKTILELNAHASSRSSIARIIPSLIRLLVQRPIINLIFK